MSSLWGGGCLTKEANGFSGALTTVKCRSCMSQNDSEVEYAKGNQMHEEVIDIDENVKRQEIFFQVKEIEPHHGIPGYDRPGRSCHNICGGGEFDIGDICFDRDDKSDACLAKSPRHSLYGKRIAEERAELQIMTLGTIVMQGVVKQSHNSYTTTRLMALYDDGALAWYLSEDDARSDSPPIRAYSIRHVSSEVKDKGDKGKTLIVKISQPRERDNVSFTLEVCSGPDAVAWHTALEQCKLENQESYKPFQLEKTFI